MIYVFRYDMAGHVSICYVMLLTGLTGLFLILINTVEALLTDTLVSGQLYLRPPCLKPRFSSHTNSVFLHSRKRTFPY